MPTRTFSPFYERIRWLPGPLLNPVGTSLALGLLSFLPLLATVGQPALEDWSLLLAGLITTAALFLHLATYVLRVMLEEMDSRLRQAHVKVGAYDLLGHTLADSHFIISGALFGLVNALIACGFGLPYCEQSGHCTGLAILADWQNVSVLVGYFLAGFVCGMAVLGIVGVCVLISNFAPHAKHTFEIKSPDGCAGMSFIGEALIIFSTITLVVGVMISIYILQTNWTGKTLGWPDFLKKAWIVFPYLMSVVVLVAPSAPIAQELREHKFRREVELKNELAGLRAKLDKPKIATAERQELRDRLHTVQTDWNELYQVRIWPFSADANAKYFSILFGSFVVHVVTALKFLPTWFMKLFGGS